MMKKLIKIDRQTGKELECSEERLKELIRFKENPDFVDRIFADVISGRSSYHTCGYMYVVRERDAK